jgi:hypothetical protein
MFLIVVLDPAIEELLRSLQQKQDDMTVILPVRFQFAARHASVKILQSDQSTYVGIGFFVRPNIVVTAYHNLQENYSDTDAIFGVVQNSDGNTETIPFSLKGCLVDFDLAVLSSTYVSDHVLPVKSDIQNIPFGSKELVVTTFNSTTVNHCPDLFSLDFGVIPAALLKISARHLLYNSNLYSGDSDAALIHSSDGSVIGIHLETVNEANESLRKKEFTVENVAESVNKLVSGLSQGFLGVRLDIPEITQLIDR